jgi:threonine dehydrogenase-like Zn-dependent dehydrogenase
MRGYYPYTGIPGHEFVGTIAAAPDAPHRVGQRVVGGINIACGQCSLCRAGRPEHCFERSVLGIQHWPGAMATYLSLPLQNLLAVPDALPDDAAVFTEPLAAALQIQRQVRIEPSHHVLVLGAGTLGQLIARSLLPNVNQLGVVARYDSQRRRLESAGVEWLPETDVLPNRYDVVIEASGSAQGFALAQNALKPGGTMVLKSTFKGRVPVTLSELVVDEISVIGSRCGPMDQAVEALAARHIDPRPLIDAQYHLERGVAAFTAAAGPGRLKVLLKMEHPGPGTIRDAWRV